MGLFFNYDFLKERTTLLEGNDDDQATDYTADTGGGDNTGAGEDDSPTDYTVPDDDGNAGDNNDQTQAADDGNEDATDYTDDGGNGGDDGTGMDDGTGDTGDGGGDTGDGTDNGGGGDDNSDEYNSDDSGGDSDNPIKDLEKEIFDQLSPEHMGIKVKEVKRRYLLLYDNIGNISDRINDIPKQSDTSKTISFITHKLDDTAILVSDYVNYTFDTKTYVENEINYRKFFAIVSAINSMLAELDEDLNKNKK